jgi:hypothetical protein
MSQTEIPREQWKTFCDQFTRQHQSWIVNLSVSDVGISAEIEAEEAEQRMRPLSRSAVFHSIAIEPHYGDYTVAIMVGAFPRQVPYFVDDPIHLFFRHTEEGAHEGLVIESASGETTLLRFRVAASPETLDGITEAELELVGSGTA